MTDPQAIFDGRTIVAIVAAIIALLSLVMALGRTPPEDTKTNLLRWAEFFGLHRIPAWVKSQNADVLAKNISIVVAAVSTGVAALSFRAALTTDRMADIKSIQDRFIQVQKERDQLAKSVATMRVSPTTTNFLNLDDVKRWHLANTIYSQTVSADNGKPCEARLFAKPDDFSAQQLSQEIPPLLKLGSWRMEGGRNRRSTFPDGVTINVGHDTGADFTCAYRLSEVLESMKIKPVNLRVNIASPDLVECKDCVEIIFGTIKKPD